MAWPASNMLEVLVLMIWACINNPGTVLEVYTQWFIDTDDILEKCTAASLNFASGLFEALQAPYPPSLTFFKTLPSAVKPMWGVYAVVLEKAGNIPLVYIGSGTDSAGGLKNRMFAYAMPWTWVNCAVTPGNVLEAIKAGYRITHRGALIWFPIPPREKAAPLRLLTLACEAAMTFAFWAMKSRKIDTPELSCCKWNLSDFGYHGLCSHSTLHENIYGKDDLKLSEDDLKAIAAALKARKSVRDKKRTKVWKKGKGAVAVAACHRRYQLKTLKSKKYYCDLCKTNAVNEANWKDHLSRKSHLKKVYDRDNNVTYAYNCRPCNYGSDNYDNYYGHCKLKRHLQRAEAARLEAEEERRLQFEETDASGVESDQSDEESDGSED